jgi:hypothetical protein
VQGREECDFYIVAPERTWESLSDNDLSIFAPTTEERATKQLVVCRYCGQTVKISELRE